MRKYQEALEDRTASCQSRNSGLRMHLKLAGFPQKEDFLKQNEQRIERRSAPSRGRRYQFRRKTGVTARKRLLQKRSRIEKIRQTIEVRRRRPEGSEEKIRLLTEKKERLHGDAEELFHREGRAFTSRKAAWIRRMFRLSARQEKLEESRDARINDMWEEYELTYRAAPRDETRRIPGD